MPVTEKRKQQQKSEDMRARLRRATLLTLMEKGFRNAGTPEICRLAGVSRGAMFHHYPNRNALLLDAAIDLWHEVPERLRGLVANLKDGEFDIDAFVDGAWENMFADDVVLPSLELTLAARSDEELAGPVAEGLQELFNSYYEILHDTFAAQGWNEGAIRDSINLVLCALRGLKVQSLVYHSPQFETEMMASLKNAFKYAIQAMAQDAN
ncbi:TetR/AcrR family transcriptional regulator [Rhodobacteraceae bacterium B1Z28]|uniref:TetR/AcrR family transcriptional regulator n=1 Tax=Ruegeria haliotis TaxID=2747601 RepID=A0ABX2PZ43_9RHOB|nr:TetR/AcrR family transcriptional regulator [Ruegeria haliotis]NVO58596.1 TetR/AcrR family transcriptional regulator [Ruegeria haliotis]